MKPELRNTSFHARAMELAVATTGHEFPLLTALHSPRAQNYRFAAATTGYSIALLDVMLDVDGHVRLIEANGSNAALSSIAANGDDTRAAHMVSAMAAKYAGNCSGVVLLGHQKGFLHIPEFFHRAGNFAELVSALWPTKLRFAAEPLGDETVTVVAGELGAIAENCSQENGQLLYCGRPVVFAANTNLLPELARQGRIAYDCDGAGIATDFFHEGRIVSLVHDKAAQQRVAARTGMTPLRFAEGFSKAECLSEVIRLRKDDLALVLKMNAGSGGTGIEFIPEWMNEVEINGRFDSIVASATGKYGADVEQTIYPVRIFEFTESTSYMLEGQPHLWDLRILCLISPGAVDVAPSVVRLCPEPFNRKTFSRDSVVSNLSGRSASLKYLMPVWQKDEQGIGSTLENCGFTRSTYDNLLKACVAWCENALTFCQ